MAQTRESRPDSGLGFPAKVIKTFYVVAWKLLMTFEKVLMIFA